ncbi:CaiB/BaiF CoA-transferase family protein, partial [Micromonospora sp. MP36]|uniref:CaiB/BaiF CoA transferase family protein n=2 Tax=unclassified Micromonospora TaxID=2617518 RepID=UPI0011DBF07F
DSIGGLAAAFAVAGALVRKQRTGQGAFLDVSMLDAALSTMGWVVSNYLIGDREPEPMGNENPTSAPSGTFATADGMLNIAANRQEQFETLCSVLGREELLADPRFRTREDRKRHRETLREELELSLRKRPAREWDELLATTGVPAARVVSVPDALASHQVTHRGLVSEVPSPAGDGGSLKVLGLPTHIDGSPVNPSSRPPLLGEHTDTVLAEFGFGATDIARLRAEGAV